MAGNIIDQRNKTSLNKIETNALGARIVQPVPYVPSSSYLAPVDQPTYAATVFRESLNPVRPPAPPASNYIVLTYGKVPGVAGGYVAPSPAGVSYYDIENNSTYFEEVGGSTYYVVV